MHFPSTNPNHDEYMASITTDFSERGIAGLIDDIKNKKRWVICISSWRNNIIVSNSEELLLIKRVGIWKFKKITPQTDDWKASFLWDGLYFQLTIDGESNWFDKLPDDFDIDDFFDRKVEAWDDLVKLWI